MGVTRGWLLLRVVSWVILMDGFVKGYREYILPCEAIKIHAFPF